MEISKIIFIGLPGAGKTTASTELAKKHDLTLIGSDSKIKEILSAYKDNTLQTEPYGKKLTELKMEFINEGSEAEMVESAFQRTGYEKHSTAFIEQLGESYWRKVEAAITVLLINEHPDCLFDLGASQVLNASVKETIERHEFYLIYLDADKDAIEQHLLTPQSDGKPRWQLISNYQKAGEQWRQLAQKHRAERSPEYEKIADKTISVYKNTSIDDIIEEAEQLAYASPSP